MIEQVLMQPSKRLGKGLRWLILPLAMSVFGAAHAATDILVNQEVCAIPLLPSDPVTCPNSLDGPAGADVTFTAKVVWNTGDNPGMVTLENDLPLGAVFQSATGTGVSCLGGPVVGAAVTASNQTVTCTLPSFAGTGDADAQRVDFKVTLPTISTSWSNVATVSPATGITDSNPSNDSLARGFTTKAAADVQLEVITDPAGNSALNPLDPGEVYTQTVRVKNNGPSDIPSTGRLEVGFTVPSGTSITQAGGSNGWTCLPNIPAGNALAESTEVLCTRPGALNTSDQPDLIIKGSPNISGSVTTGFSVQGYQAAGDKPMPDGQPDNNTAIGIVHASIANTADMTINKARVGAGNRALGDTVTYTITPRFLGGKLPAGAVFTVTDVPSAGLSFVSASGDANWVCAANECTYTVPSPAPANYSNLPPITVQATVTEIGPQANIATIAFVSGATDPKGDNNTSTATVTGSDSSDLRMAKSASNYQHDINVAVPIGTPYQYTLAVHNDGPLAIPAAGGTTPAIEIQEAIPAGITIQSVNTANGWDCSGVTFPAIGPTSFTCTYSAGLNNNTSRTLVLDAIRTTDGIVSNSACAKFGSVTGTPTRQDSNIDNDCQGVAVGASSNTTDPVTADLSIVKTVDKTAVFAGEDLTYTLTVTNNSATQPSTDVFLSDELMSLVTGAHGPSLVSVVMDPLGPTCTPSAPAAASAVTLQCDLGTLAANATQDIIITIRPTVDEVAVVRTNSASVFSSTVVDPDLANNTTTVTRDTTVTARVDLVAKKEVTTSEGGGSGNVKSAAAGSLMKYTVQARNDGPSSAENVWLRDVLPSEAILVGAPVPENGGNCVVVSAATSTDRPTGAGTPHPAGAAGGVLECVWGTDTIPVFQASAGQCEVNYDMRSVPGTTVDTLLENIVTIGTKTNEPNTDNNTANAKVTLTKEELDVLIQMTHDTDGISLGAIVKYEIRILNGGPTFATDVVMKNVFPTTNASGDPSSATFAYLAATLSADPDASCVAPTDGATNGELVCTFPVLAPGETRTIRFEMQAAGLPAGAMSGTIFHLATVTPKETEWLSGSADDPLANNAVRDLTSTNRATENADLALIKTADVIAPQRVKPGDTLTYTLVVSNAGPAISKDAQVVDTLPEGLVFVSASAGCVEVAGTVTCPVGELAVNAETEFTIVTEVTENVKSSIINTALVDAPGDPNTPNNEDDEKTPVVPPATAVPVDNPIALLLLVLAMMGLMARHYRRRA